MYDPRGHESVLEGGDEDYRSACLHPFLSLSPSTPNRRCHHIPGSVASWILNGLGQAPADSLGWPRVGIDFGGTSSFTRLKILFILPTVALVCAVPAPLDPSPRSGWWARDREDQTRSRIHSIFFVGFIFFCRKSKPGLPPGWCSQFFRFVNYDN